MRESVRFNRLIPELYCSDFERSFDFYTRIAGFTLLYKREEDRCAFFEREGAQLMIEQSTVVRDPDGDRLRFFEDLGRKRI